MIMARSINEIKKGMTDEFMADSVVREKYGLKAGDSFSECFSVVSIENVLFYTVAACCHILEMLFDAYKEDVNRLVEGAVVASVPWYHKVALQFQYGDSLVFDETTQRYIYANEEARKQVVKYVAVRDKGTSITLLVSGEENGRPSQLSDDVLTAFRSYMDRVKIAGVVLNVRSLPADSIKVYAKVYIDPLVIDTAGKRISDGSKPVEEAIENYLRGILYGGTFYNTKLVDAIQRVEGVTDVELSGCSCKNSTAEDYTSITGNSHAAAGGSFIVSDLSQTLSYEVQS